MSGLLSLNLLLHITISFIKGELQRENKLISSERAFKMLKNDMYIAGIGQAVLELLSFKVGSGNHHRGLSLLQKYEARSTENDVTSEKSHFPSIKSGDIF